jgi:hypothetical protein
MRIIQQLCRACPYFILNLFFVGLSVFFLIWKGALADLQTVNDTIFSERLLLWLTLIALAHGRSGSVARSY